MMSPLMSEQAAMEYLGVDKKGLRKLITSRLLTWHQGTRTFARVQVESLARRIEEEILGNHESALGSGEQSVGSLGGEREEPSLVPIQGGRRDRKAGGYREAARIS